MNTRVARERHKVLPGFLLFILLATASGLPLSAQDAALAKKLQGFDASMAKVLKDWNAPGIGVGIVSGDKLVFAKGYGYRDFGKKLPITESTLFQIASNTKLFTATAAGMLVEEGKLTWDKPVRDSVPAIRFYDDQLNNTVTLRDMLAHRTGITRHDAIWYKSDFTRKELFDRVKYLEPSAPLRQTFLYNNLMYAAAGYIIELQTGKTWENFVQERIFNPLGMAGTVFAVADMRRQPDRSVLFNEKRDGFELYEIPYYEDQGPIGPCGAIISNIRDLSHWLAALMNEGRYEGLQVLPAAVLKATLEPAIPLPNAAELQGYGEILNPAYGMARETVSYRGHLLTLHGGDLSGIHSQISFLPKEKLGVIVFAIGDHCQPLYNAVSYNVYERLLGLAETPWSARSLETRLKMKKAGTASRAKAGADRVPGTKPSHALADYAASFENPAYGALKVSLENGGLQAVFHKIKALLSHFHYDRFDGPDDESIEVKFSINFQTNPQGDIDKAVMSLDEAEVVFARKAEKPGPEILAKLAGTYDHPAGLKIQVIFKEEDGTLSLVIPGQLKEELVPYKGFKFKIKAFSDTIFEFVVENGQVKALKQITPAGENVFPRR